MLRLIAITAIICSAAGSGRAQVFNDLNPYAQSSQDRMEVLRQRNDRLADYAQQYRTQTRLTLFELRQRRQAEPDLPQLRPLAGTPAVSERRETDSIAEREIDNWLDRRPE